MALLHLLHPLEDVVVLPMDACSLLGVATPIQDACVRFESGCEAATEGLEMLTDQLLVEVGGFSGGLEGLMVLSVVS